MTSRLSFVSMSTLAQRVRHARKKRGLSQEKLAERLNISRGACGHWERGIAKPSTQNLFLLAQILRISTNWLLTGEGDMEHIAVQENASPSYVSLEDAELREVIDIFYRLSQKQRFIILQLLREF